MTRYKVKSMERVESPVGSTKSRWYKFVIENDKNTITNLRSGSREEVRSFASESVKRLNEKYLTHIKFKIHKPVYENTISSYL